MRPPRPVSLSIESAMLLLYMAKLRLLASANPATESLPISRDAFNTDSLRQGNESAALTR